jgi:hypothetical protein
MGCAYRAEEIVAAYHERRVCAGHSAIVVGHSADGGRAVPGRLRRKFDIQARGRAAVLQRQAKAGRKHDYVTVDEASAVGVMLRAEYRDERQRVRAIRSLGWVACHMDEGERLDWSGYWPACRPPGLGQDAARRRPGGHPRSAAARAGGADRSVGPGGHRGPVRQRSRLRPGGDRISDRRRRRPSQPVSLQPGGQRSMRGMCPLPCRSRQPCRAPRGS